MEDDAPSPPRRPSISQLSRTPSWVMLGFILGALFVWKLPRPQPVVRPIMMAPAPAPPRTPEPPQLTTVEAVFEQWSKYAVWDDGQTQIAVWNPGMGDFTDLYDVRRIDGNYYFRSIPRLTHPILRHGKLPPAECPVRFTETEEQYLEWRNTGRFERPPDDGPPVMSVPRATAPVLVPSMEGSAVRPPAPAPVEKSLKVVPKP
ncbi:MAG TPA: hypothetical protein VHE61_03885 [Opitutaceae bacterium]|nr:hypothetical protein [Opitutaceae bacterium]